MTAEKKRLVTVDGPAGSGKTTLGQELARRLELPLVDTGLFYRAVMVAAVRAGIDARDSRQLSALIETTRMEINTQAQDRSWQVKIDGVDAGELLRDPRHALLLSAISQTPEVRRLLLERQRDSALQGAVAVGRDCGTVVFPDAPLKLYLQAPEGVRAGRRAAQLATTGISVDAGELAAEVSGRDAGDSASLQPASDAHVIDTSTLAIEEMVGLALTLCRQSGVM